MPSRVFYRASCPVITFQKTIQNDSKCVKKIKTSPQESGRPFKRRSEVEMFQIVKEILKTPQSTIRVIWLEVGEYVSRQHNQ